MAIFYLMRGVNSDPVVVVRWPCSHLRPRHGCYWRPVADRAGCHLIRSHMWCVIVGTIEEQRSYRNVRRYISKLVFTYIMSQVNCILYMIYYLHNNIIIEHFTNTRCTEMVRGGSGTANHRAYSWV